MREGEGRLWFMKKVLTGLLTGLVVLAAGIATAQTDSVTTLQARSTLVLVPTTVRTKAGAPVFTLKAEDFNVTDDGVPQRLRLEEDSGALPLALVVVIEAGGEGAGKLDQYGTLSTMVEAIAGGVPHKVALVGFDSEPALVQPWTESFDKLHRAIADLGPGDGKAAILDSLRFSVDLLKMQPISYRRAILLVSETLDHGSQMRLDDAIRAVSDNNTVIYSLGFSSTRAQNSHELAEMSGGPGSKPGPAGGCMGKYPPPKDGERPIEQGSKAMQAYDCLSDLAPPLRLAKMAVIAAINGFRTNVPETAAKLTGGEYFKFENAKALEKGMQAISNRLPNRYFLSFQPQQPHPGLHAIGVELKDYSGLVVESRKSYWAGGAGTP